MFEQLACGGVAIERLAFQLISLVILLVLVFWLFGAFRKAMSQQKQAIDRQKEAMDDHKKAIEQVGESLELSRKSLESQEKIISLLEEIRDAKQS